MFVAPLNRARIEYMVTGGFAAIVYGHPRLTLDLDLVLRLDSRDAATFAGIWAPGEFYCPPVETIAVEAARDEHGHFNVVHGATSLRADIYLAGTGELQRWALGRTVAHRIADEDVRVAPVEYVIVYKLSYAKLGQSDRHLHDVARMLEIQGPSVDQRALDPWIDRLAVRAQWERARDLVGRE